MRKFLLGVVVGLVLAGISVFSVVLAVVFVSDTTPSVPVAATVVLNLHGEIPERPPSTLPIPAFEDTSPPSIFDVWRALDRARTDTNVKAILLNPRGLAVGWGKLAEIREGIVKFRKSGKPVYAYLRNPRTPEYYLATAADKIFMAPEDLLDVKGLRAQLTFLRGSLDKLGVQMEIEHAGKYKDAGDMFTRTSMSPETREVLTSVLDRLFDHLTGTIAASRKRTVEQVRASIDDGPFLGPQAVKHSLVDELLFEDQVLDQLSKQLGQKTLNRINHRDYVRSLGSDSGTRIALVTGEGAIVRGSGGGLFTDEGVISSGPMTRVLREVREDASIRAVILRIDSPGGDAIASDDILREAKLLSQRKPLIVSMSDVAASGGYFVAMTGDNVLAYPNTITGSIGVIYGKANLRGLYDKLGIRQEMITRGRFAGIDSEYEPLSDPARKKLREGVDAVYKTFVQHVADARKRPYDEIEKLAQGRVWLGSQAKENALVDELGGLDRAIELVRAKAKIPAGEKVALTVYPRPRSVFDQLLSRSPDSAAAETWLRATARRIGWNVAPLLEGGMLKLMPFELRIH